MTDRAESRFESIADRLDGIVDELEDVITKHIRDALESAKHDGRLDPEALAEEKRVARARRSVAKAAAILRRDPARDEAVGSDQD